MGEIGQYNIALHLFNQGSSFFLKLFGILTISYHHKQYISDTKSESDLMGKHFQGSLIKYIFLGFLSENSPPLSKDNTLLVDSICFLVFSLYAYSDSYTALRRSTEISNSI